MKTTTIYFLLIFFPLFSANSQSYFSNANTIDDDAGADDIFICDMNADGNEDVLFVSETDDIVGLFKNNGNGTFAPLEIIDDLLIFPGYIVASDIDNDQDQDIIVGAPGFSELCLYRSDGLGNYSYELISIDVYWISSLHVFDIDGDLDDDILITSNDISTLAWFENDGTGNFSSMNTITNYLYQPEDAYASHIDDDGNIDIVFASNDTLAFLKSNGNNVNFLPSEIIATNLDNITSVLCKDLDNDGDNDIIATARDMNKVVWIENMDGQGTFSNPKIISDTSDNVIQAAASDIDQDGDVIDIARFGDRIVWYENLNGLGDFSIAHTISNTAYNGRGIFPADIDNDSDIDIAAIYGGDALYGEIVWFENINIKIMTQPKDTTVNPYDSTCFSLIAKDYEQIKWQMNNGTGFHDLNDDTIFNGVANDTLRITNVPETFHENSFRCIVSNDSATLISDTATLNVDFISIEMHNNEGMHIFPNPASQLINVLFPVKNDWSLEIFNIHGKFFDRISTRNSDAIFLDISNYPAGIYLLKGKARNNNKTLSAKIIKE